MIGYSTDRQSLENLIEAQSPGWLERSGARTNAFRAAGRYSERSAIWSEVKVVYMRLQGESKCAYCERKLESEEYGKGEQDVEHFRPKKGVKAWKPPKDVTAHGIRFAPLPPAGKGYYLIAYHPFNYAAACKPCNSALKRDYFPVARFYDLDGDDPSMMLKEKPYLIYPIGDFDASPDTLIEFHGLSPRAVFAHGWQRDRALVTISFFRLADITRRKNLFHERALLLIALYPQLVTAHNTHSSDEDRAVANALIYAATQPNIAHCNCNRSFVRLYDSDPAGARAIFRDAVKFVHSTS